MAEQQGLNGPQMKRRAFVQSSLATVAMLGLAGCGNTLSEADGKQGDASRGEGSWKTLACMQSCGGRCLNKGLVVDGVIVRQKTDDTHEDSQEFPQQRGCLRGRSIGQMAFGADRLKYPMKRKNWQPGGTDFHPELRGKDEWERLSWDDAVKLVADETKRIYETYGPRSVFVPSFFDHDLLNYLGGYVGIWDTNSQGTARLGPAMLGLTENAKRGQANDRLDMAENADVIVLYGCNPAWSAMGSPSWHFWAAKERGAKFIFVGSSYNMSASLLDAEWVRVRPGTDTAFLLATAYEMVRLDAEGEGLVDWDFLHTRCVGFDGESLPPKAGDEHFLGYLRGDYDGVAKTPGWASERCGTPEEDITAFARAIGKDGRVMILHAYAAFRCNGAEDMPQLMMTIGAMGGHFGKPGHACGSYYVDSASDGPVDLIVTGSNGAADAAKKLGVQTPDFGARPDDVISSAEAWDAVVSGSYRFVGNPNAGTVVLGEDRSIDIRMIDAAQCSPLRSFPNTLRGIEAYRSEHVEFVVNRSYVPRMDAQFADIVLPVISDLEKPGMLMGTGDGGREIVLLYGQVCEPVFEAKSNEWIDSKVLEAMGFDPRGLHPLSEQQALFNQIAGTTVVNAQGDGQEPLVTITAQDLEAWGVEGVEQQGRIALQEFVSKGVYQIERRRGDAYGYIAYEDFVADPQKNPRASESGLFEISCRWKADALNRFKYSDDVYKPYPTYHVPVEGYETTFSDWEGKVKGDFPFLCYNPHYPRFGNGVYGNAPLLAENLETPVFLSASDAAERGIADGDAVLVTSRRGKVLRRASCSELVQPGCVGLPNGPWARIDDQGIDRAGGVNTLTGARRSGLGVAGYNTTNVNIEKWTGDDLRDDADAQVILAVQE
ncbi:molybdopterin-dependent oxidoreductase [Eggerthella sinensis]|uniref:molybdopterin-dependent oxidoreductase n=1 Tax=Eggerthella sinensis TaxID=242230 RepID=UPI00266B3BDC|nr:molybdopterin-dependent oxidoreductase [Eggerthella sinensis]